MSVNNLTPDVIAAKVGSRVTDAERITIDTLRQQNLSIDEIARALHRNSATVDDVVTNTQALMKARSLKAAADWDTASSVAAARGNHKPAKDWLIATKAIDPPYSLPNPTTSGVTVQIGFALPGLPLPSALPALTITNTHPKSE